MMLEEAGFKGIGMDHFALPGDKLFAASENGTLHRNFMGYTTTSSKLIIGLGASAISASKNAFAQNEKTIEEYQDNINSEVLALINGHSLSGEDSIIQNKIHELMCLNTTTLNTSFLDPEFLDAAFCKLKSLERDGLVKINGDTIYVTDMGALFIRNICAAIDLRIYKNKILTQNFSQAI